MVTGKLSKTTQYTIQHDVLLENNCIAKSGVWLAFHIML